MNTHNPRVRNYEVATSTTRQRSRSCWLLLELVRAHLGITYDIEQWGAHEREVLKQLELIHATRSRSIRETEEGVRIIVALIRTFEGQVLE